MTDYIEDAIINEEPETEAHEPVEPSTENNVIDSITDYMSFNMGTAFVSALALSPDDTYTAQNIINSLNRAYSRDDNHILPADLIHTVYKIAAENENSVIARLIVSIASSDLKTAYICCDAIVNKQ